MAQSTQEEIIRTLESSDLLHGGQLNPEQQTRFLQLVAQFSTMLDIVRMKRMMNPKVDIDKINIGEPVTESADENTFTGNTNKPAFNQISLDAKKVRSSWNATTEVFQSNIERDNIDDTLMAMMSERIATDLEWLAIQGNTTLGTSTPLDRLLRRLDGWDKQTDSCHIVDFGGQSIRKAVFSEIIRSMPEMYMNNPGMRWFVSRVTAIDWMDVNADRQTSLGDNALQGRGVAPFGIPMISKEGQPGIPLIPSTKSLVVAEATPAEVMGNRFDTFEIVAGTNDKMQIDVDNIGAVAITLAAGVWRVAEIAKMINDALVTGGSKAIATDDRLGHLVFISPTTGAASEIDIQAIANDAYSTLGFAVGVTNGVAAGGSGTVNEGTFIWLANPQNFIWGILAANDPNGQNGTRVYSEFNKDFDRLEVVVYNQIDAKVENNDAIVKGINVRRRQLT